MEAHEWKILELSTRYIARVQRKGTRGNIAKAIAELIKNADDTYYRAGITAGKIEIGYWKLKKTQRRTIGGFYVRDWGQGMNLDIATRAYTRYGEDTSEGGRNAAIGVGGKDALYGMRECYVFTVRNATPLVIEIRTNPSFNALESRIAQGEEARKKFQAFNEKITPHALPLDISQNGTTVAFRIPSNIPGPRVEKIAEALSNYYTLRRIMESPSRTVELLDLESGQKKRISHTPLKGKVVHRSPPDFGITYDGTFYDIDIEIQKYSGQGSLNKEIESGDNLLVTDENGAILDNTMTDELRPAANPFFGAVIIHDWRQLYGSDETILTENREGLDYNNDFNRELKKRLHDILKELVDKEERESGTSVDLDQDLRKRVRRAFKKINDLIRKENLGAVTPDEVTPSVPEGLKFSPQQLATTVGTKRYLHLLFNPEKVPANSEISLNVLGKGISVSPSDFVETGGSHDDQKVPQVSINVVGEDLEGSAIVKATFKDLEASAEISVVPEEELQPDNGFAFMPSTRTILKTTKSRIRLVIDTRIVPRNSLVVLSCDDDRIKLVGFKRFLVGTPNLSQYLKEEYIETTAEVPGIRGQICAHSRTSDNREIETFCTVRVVEREPPKDMFKEHILSPEGDERQRASFKDGIVYIHTRSPVLRRYFGDPIKCERLHASSGCTEAKVMLADTIVHCITEEWARAQVENQVIPVLATIDEEIKRQARKLDFQYGRTIHEIIVSSLK